ncbi:uncharacterized protein LOC123316119 isoform X2 [Coccinella septempunctata]|uniref:uncharacterized protein LOC123316119 isoform X2 n=1 Tax=Coccinella septempunctata TaxID=41139 RepID=UPI001D07F042|nr:uncharacterized protein LOC123316119 isoform X2 [Coccinella septempunctata]
MPISAKKDTIYYSLRKLLDISTICCLWRSIFTLEVFNAICVRLGHTVHIPEQSLESVFNEMQLYPSKSQVSAMLQCARQCSKRNGNYVTFGEFCVLVKEMQKQSPKQQRNSQVNNYSKCKKHCEVFLGGSCNPTTWRADTAIPALQREGISFYNPQVSMWAPELLVEEYKAKESASILFFVVDSQTRSIGGMIEVADLIASGRCVVVVAYPYHQNQKIMGEVISHREYKDLVDGQSNLLMLVKSRGIKVHKNLSTALKCTANILRNSSSNGIKPEQQIMNKLRRLREVFDSYGGQSGDISLLKALEAYEEITQRSLHPTQLHNYLLSKTNANNFTMDVRISFDKFCALVAEFSTDGCDTCRNEWANKTFQRQMSNNNNNNSCNVEFQPINLAKNYTYDVYLGGSLATKCNWRNDVAIPLLKKHGLSYYNPAIRENIDILDNMTASRIYQNGNTIEAFPDEKILEWKEVIDRSYVAIFVISNDTRSLTSMILAAYYIGLNEKVVLCIQDLPSNCVIDSEVLSDQAVKDYNRGRAYLTDLARRKNVPMFRQIDEAVVTAINLCKNR